MSTAKEAGDAGLKLAKAHFEQWLDGRVSDPKMIQFMLDHFELAYDLIMDSIRNGGMPTKGDVIRYLAGKANTFSGFSEASRVECVSSIVTLGLTANAAPVAGATGPIGWTWYVAAILLDGLDAGGSCYLAFKDAEVEWKLEAFRKQIEARRAWGFANAASSVAQQQTLATGLEAILQYESRRPLNRSSVSFTPR